MTTTTTPAARPAIASRTQADFDAWAAQWLPEPAPRRAPRRATTTRARRRPGTQHSHAATPRRSGSTGGTATLRATSNWPAELAALLQPQTTLMPDAITSTDQCDWCTTNGPEGCPSCAVRARKAVRLRGKGWTPEQTAVDMGISFARVERLLEQHDDREELKALACNEIPNERVRKLFERRKLEDPTFTIARLADLADFSCSSHVERDLGYMPTSPTTTKGKFYPGKIKTTISVKNASRLVLAMGYAPAEVEGL